MNDVSSLAARTILAMADRAGVPPDELLAGLAFDSAALARMRRVSWEDFCTIVERLEAALGGPPAWEALVRETLHTSVPRELAWVTRGIVSPRFVYQLVFGIVAPAMFPNLDLELRDLSDGRLRVSCRIRAGSRPCPAFLRGCAAGVDRVVAHLDVQTPMTLEELSDRTASAVLRLPPWQSLLARGKGALGSSLVTMGRRMMQAYTDQVAQLGRTAYDQTNALADIGALGRELARELEVSALGERLVAMLAGLGWQHIALTLVAGGEERSVCRRSQAPAVVQTWPLQIGERELGRLELAGAGDAELVAQLVPWISLAVDSALAAETSAAQRLGERRRRVDERRRELGLTPRQAEVLERVAAGASNPEIAAALGCAERTVESHISALLKKLRAEGRSELIAKVWSREGLE